MSNYATLALAKGQAIVTSKYNAPELRRQMPTVMELALKNQHISIPDAQALRVSPLRPVDVNYMKTIAPGSATAKAYNHTGSIGDSGSISVTYVQHVETFSLNRKIAFNSVATYEKLLQNQYEQAWMNLRSRHDTSALSYLKANKNTLTSATMNPRLASSGLTWNDTTLAVDITADKANYFIAQLKAGMNSSFYTGEYDVVCDLQLGAKFEQYMNQGSGNQFNLGYQFAGCNFTRTQQTVDSAYGLGAVLAMPKSAFAGLCWNEGLNVKGDFGGEGSTIGILTTVPDPMGSGAIADLSMYTQRSDTSGNTTGGSTEDFVDQWEVTLTVGYVVPPLSLSLDSPVIEFGQAS